MAEMCFRRSAVDTVCTQ